MNSSEQLRVKNEELRVDRDSVVVAVHDTIMEVSTITYVLRQAQEPNEPEDTVKVTTVTDRLRARERDAIATQRTKTEVRVDTVYIQKDSVSIEDKKIGLSASTDGSPKRSGFLTYVKWIFALICAIVVLIITAKLCLHR